MFWYDECRLLVVLLTVGWRLLAHLQSSNGVYSRCAAGYSYRKHGRANKRKRLSCGLYLMVLVRVDRRKRGRSPSISPRKEA